MAKSQEKEGQRTVKNARKTRIYVEGAGSTMYVPTPYRAADVRVSVREHGLEAVARRAGVDELTLARYCLRLGVERDAARAIEAALLADAA